MPALRSRLIARPQLVDRLNSGLGNYAQDAGARLLLVCAPAGFGKTTLVTTWLAQAADVRSAWLSLDEGDNDPVRFLTYLIAALQIPVPGLGQTAARLLQSPQPPPAEAIMTLVINDISQNVQPIILVLDDYHVITSPSIHQALSYLIDHLPPSLHLLINTRSDPSLPLSRLRARGQLLEIRADVLRFSLDEAGLFFSQVMDLALANEDLAALEQRTEGWIAGLQLAALSMQGRDDLPDFISAFTGSNRYILDYLTDEVMDRRPEGTKNFLLQTSILSRLCGPLCDAVTGQSEGQAMLEKLEQANLFLIPLDEERRWYRYHHLFAEALRRRLQQEQSASLVELHRRAREWFELNGFPHDAVHHALAGQDYEEAARLIEGVAGAMLRMGASPSLIRWLDAVPEEVIRARPRLCLAWGWTFLWGPELSLESVDKWVQFALQAAKAHPPPDSELAGEAAALQAITATIRGDVAQSREISLHALENLAVDSPWRSVVAFSLGTGYYSSGDMPAAARLLNEAVQLSQVDGALYILLTSASFIADIQVYQGRLGQAMEMYQRVLEWAGHATPHKGALMAHGGLADILYERNQLEAALAHIQIASAQLEQIGGSWAPFMIYRTLARIHWGQSNWKAALEALERAYQAGQRTKVNYVMTQAAALRASLLLAQGDLRAAAVWAANSGLNLDNLDNSLPGFKDVEYITLARVLNAQGRHADALSILDRLLISAESEERIGNGIVILILQSLVLQAQGDTARAFKCLERALLLAEPEGYCRVFLDEGEPLRALLLDYRSHFAARALSEDTHEARRHLAYITTLLAAFPIGDRTPRAQPEQYPDSLSERELEVLILVATGASNRDIADKLYLAVPTVKKHVSNIMSKLDASSRTQAAAQAHEMGLF